MLFRLRWKVAPRKPSRKTIREAQQRESRTLGLEAQRRRGRPVVYNYSYEDTIKGQTYITFDGLQVDREIISELITYDTGDDANQEMSDNDHRVAQSFTVGSTDIWVSTIEIKATEAGNASPNAKVTIQKTTAGEPNGVIMDTDIKTNAWNGTTSFETFTFDNVRLLAGVTYAIVLGASGYGIVPNESTIGVRVDSSSPTYTGGSIWTSTDAEANWSVDATKDMMFRINGKANNSHILFPAANINSTDDITSVTGVELNLNFDFIVNSTVAIKGMVLLDISGTAEIMEVDLIDWNGTTGTSLVTGTTDSGTATLAMDITTWKRIRRGNTLRLNVKYTNAASGTLTINHSGNNLKLHLPFRVEMPE